MWEEYGEEVHTWNEREMEKHGRRWIGMKGRKRKKGKRKWGMMVDRHLNS